MSRNQQKGTSLSLLLAGGQPSGAGRRPPEKQPQSKLANAVAKAATKKRKEPSV